MAPKPIGFLHISVKAHLSVVPIGRAVHAKVGARAYLRTLTLGLTQQCEGARDSWPQPVTRAMKAARATAFVGGLTIVQWRWLGSNATPETIEA